MQDRLTAPPKYGSNHEAILELIRYGPGVWGTDGFLVLLFHAERTTAQGLVAHQVSKSQAAKGIVDASGRCIRAKSGLGEMSWKIANAQLSRPGGPIRRYKHGDEPTEYWLHWPAIHQAIEEFKARPLPEVTGR